MATTIYWVVYANGAGLPSNDQIRLGQNSSGGAALASGSAAYTSPGTYTFPPAFTGLSPNTPYQEAFVAYDDVALAYSNRVESATITTTGGTVYADSRAESVALSDSPTSTATLVVARAESVALSDSQSTGPATYTVTQPETIALVDTSNATVAVAGLNTVTEVVTLNDAQTVAIGWRVAVNETFSLSDASAVRTTYVVSRAESIVLSDTSTGTLPAAITGTVNESFSLIANQDAYINELPVGKLGHFGEPKKEGIKAAEAAMIQLEDEFILEIVLSLAVKGAIA